MGLNFVSLVPNDTVWVTILYYNSNCSGEFEKSGWWGLTDGQMATAWGGECCWLNRYFYFHAESNNGLEWNGDINVTVGNNAFAQCVWDNTGQNRTVSYRLIDVGDNWDYTINLVPANYTPPPQSPPPSSGGGSPWGDDDDDDGGDDDDG